MCWVRPLITTDGPLSAQRNLKPEAKASREELIERVKANMRPNPRP